MRLRGIRQRELPGDIVDARPAASHFVMSACAAASSGGGSANSTSVRSAMHFSISSRIGTTGVRLPLVA